MSAAVSPAQEPQGAKADKATAKPEKATSKSSPAANDLDGAPPGLSGKELKAWQKAEKQKRRAAQKEAAGLPPRSDAPVAAAGAPGARQGHMPADKRPAAGSTHTTSAPTSHRVPLFGHLDAPSSSAVTAAASKDIHPAILQLGVNYSSYKVLGSSARCRAMLEAFKHFIVDYRTPDGTTLSRNLTNQLSTQIDFVKTARPLSVTMGNAIRWLKQEITTISIDLTEQAAKQELLEAIDAFIRERLDVADQVIMEAAAHSINDGDIVLTYARSEVVKLGLIAAHGAGKKFSVIVVDSRPLFEGKKLVQDLVDAGLSCTYVLINALAYVIQDVTTVFLGAHAMFSNGQLFSRVGSAIVATAAKLRNIPVIVLCETIKFTDRVHLDSVTFNELASTDSLANLSIDPEESYVPSPAIGPNSPSNLSILNILYDLTPPSAIKKVITEVGSLPASSVPVILREYKTL